MITYSILEGVLILCLYIKCWLPLNRAPKNPINLTLFANLTLICLTPISTIVPLLARSVFDNGQNRL